MQGRNARVLELEGSLAVLEAQQASMEEAAQSQHADVRFIDFAHMLLYVCVKTWEHTPLPHQDFLQDA